MGDPVVLGKRIRRLRRALDLTQAQLGAQVGIAQNSVSAIESGTIRPSAGTLGALAGALGVTVDDLTAPGPLASPESLQRVAEAASNPATVAA